MTASKTCTQSGHLGEQIDKVSWELLETYEALSTIFKSAQLLAVSQGVEQAAEITLECALETTESSGGMIFYPGEEGLEVLATFNSGPDVGEAAEKRLSRHGGKPYYEDRIDENLCAMDGSEIQSTLYVPIPIEEGQYALVFLFSCASKEYSSIDVKRIQILCCQGALAVRCFKHLDELKEKNTALECTLKRLTEAQEELVKSERLSTLGQMASAIVHDIKNPMGGLLGYAQILEQMAEELSPQEVKEYSGIIIKEMLRLSNMTGEIMEFSRGVESKLNTRELTPRNLVAVAAPLIESDFASYNIKFDWEEVDDERIVIADSDKMERVFINLAVNARQAMEKGGRFSISSSFTENNVVFSIKDTGCGVPLEIGDKLFEPFTTRKKGQSLGIGLAVSRWIVEAHGGKIWVHSSSADGTEFRISLPTS